MIKELTPPQAWQYLQQNPQAKLIDVRTKVEFAFVGHPLGALHIAWKEAPDWWINSNFVAQVEKHVADRDIPLLLLCRSGQRSMEAAKELERSGFQRLFNILEGFEGDLDENRHRGYRGGWRFHGLPWEQS